MGTDITAYFEIRIDDEWHFFGQVEFDRDYYLFALMADVKNNGEVKPIALPKGLPEDLSTPTILLLDYYNEYNKFGESWLSYKEILKVLAYINEESILGHKDVMTEHYNLGAFIERWEEIKLNPDYLVQDTRLVFWFDN